MTNKKKITAVSVLSRAERLAQAALRGYFETGGTGFIDMTQSARRAATRAVETMLQEEQAEPKANEE